MILRKCLRVLATACVFLGIVMCLLLILVSAVAYVEYNRVGPLEEPVTIVIPRGTSAFAIGRQLAAAHVLRFAPLFGVAAHLQSGNLQAGEYAFTPHQTIAQLIDQMNKGRVVIHHITIPEGLTVAQIVALVQREPGLIGTITTLPPEGSLLPETYNFVLGEWRDKLIADMIEADTKMVSNLWDLRDPHTILKTPQEALILASIVEKETGVAAERPKVAAVFLNRLKWGMRLQSDPTIIYALTKGKGALGRPLSHDDLSFQTPYNSYLYQGLPPTPITNPGRAALAAVLNPDPHDYYYFVATGQGGHAFAETLDEHNANVQAYRDYLQAHPSGAQ